MLQLFNPFILGISERRFIMSGNYDPIDMLLQELKSNATFLDKLLFPKLSLLIGTIGTVAALVIFLR